MKSELNDYRLIERWASQSGGVFSLADLRNLFDEKRPLLLQRRVAALIKHKALARFKREFYLTDSCNLEILSQRVYPDSYISFGNALARHLLIGSIPAKTIYAVKTGRSRNFSCAQGSVVYCGMAEHLFFGWEYEQGIRYALKEKAFLDALHFYQKGFRFSFNLFKDVDMTRLDQGIINEMLRRYKNPKYLAFVRGVLRAGC